jgi:SAM-dependent methyltransferase
VLWHVLEHLDDPRAALARLHGWLDPGGLLLVAVPNPASLQARIAGAAWMHWDVPRHRVHLTPRGLTALLESTGFELVRVEHLVWEHNPPAMWMALLSRLGLPPAFPFHLLKRNVAPRPRDLALLLVAGPALLPVALALEALAAAARRGGTVAVVARRRTAY